MSRPAFGEADIRCARRRCKWIGKETELKQVPSRDWPGAMQNVCPACGGGSYEFVEPVATKLHLTQDSAAPSPGDGR